MYAKNKSLKLFYEKYCFLPIAQFELNDSTDHLQYVNIFIVMKIFLPWITQCKKMRTYIQRNYV